MPLTLNGNASQLNITGYLNQVNRQLNKSLERLSSGYKLNHASDGPADIAMAASFNSQIRGYQAASGNVQQGLSMLQIADGALQQINDHLQNIRAMAVQAANGTNSTAQYTAFQDALTQELAALNSIASGTQYSGNVLLDGSISGGSGFKIQIGPNSADVMDIKSAFTNNTSGASGLNLTQTTLASAADATTLLGQVDSAISSLGGNLATLGSYEDRMTNRLNYLDIAQTNTASSLSSIRDTDVAAESSKLARLQILQQAGVYALAQSNSFSALALTLLR